MKYKITYLLIIASYTLCAQLDIEWVLQSYGKSSEYINSLATDKEDNIYITGDYFHNELLLGAYVFKKGRSRASSFIAKIDKHGEIVWAKSMITVTGWPNYSYVDADDEGNMYLSASFLGKVIVIGEDTIYNPNTFEQDITIYLAKFDPTGKLIFVKNSKITERGEVYSSEILVDAKRGYAYTYITTNSDLLTFDSFEIKNPSPVKRLHKYILKWDLTGRIIWAIPVEASKAKYLNTLQLDSKGNILVNGSFYGSKIWVHEDTLYNTHPDTNTTVGFLIKLTPDGELIWSKVIGARTFDSRTSFVKTDQYDNIYLNGFYRDQLIIGGDTLSNPDFTTWDYYLIKYSPEGTPLWTRTRSYGFSPGNESVAITPGGNIFLHSHFTDSVLYLGEYEIVNNGGLDNIIVYYNPQGDIIWAYGYGGTDFEAPLDIATDSEGNLILPGRFKSKEMWLGEYLLTNEFTVDSLGGTSLMNFFVAKVIPDTSTSIITLSPSSLDIKAHYRSADNGIYLTVNGMHSGTRARIDVFDMSGRLLRPYITSISSSQYLIEASSLPAAAYIIRVSDGVVIRSVPVVVVR